MSKQAPNAREAAFGYRARGWKPVPIPSGQKRPTHKNWQLVDEPVMTWHGNVGVQFGAVSNGLCDVDLDCAEARALAAYFLPDSKAVFGRKSTPAAHWLYVTDLWREAKTATVAFDDPVQSNSAQSEHGVRLVELRTGRGEGEQIKGALSVFPPSVHPSGERVRWDRDGEPSQVDGSALTDAVSTLAAATLLVRHYPATGKRHDAALVLGGFLARAGWDAERIGRFVEAVTQGAQDDEGQERVNTAKSAVGAMRSGTDVPGMPRLRGVFGDAVAGTLAKWLGVQSSSFGTQDERIREQIAELARLSNIDYDRARDDAAKKLNIRMRTLDDEVEKARAERARQAAETPPLDLGELAALSAEIIASEDVLALFAQEIGRYIAGEQRNAKLLYLVGTSRLFDKAMHAAIKGPSSGGKSEIRKHVLEYFPPEDVVSFTSMSERALLFMDVDFPQKILSMGEAISGEELKFQDYLLRELMSEGVLRYPVAQKVGGGIKTVVIEKHGPVAFMVTTTRNKLHTENETRMLSLEVNDSEQQTRAVMRKVAEAEGLNITTKGTDFRPWQNFQRWLATGEREVVIPFATTLARLIPAKAVRLRRDVGQLLRAVKTHALVHRQHRGRDDDGYIVATIEQDYAAVRPLMSDIVATAAEVKVRQAIKETIEAVKDLQQNNITATVRDVAKKLHLDRTTAWRRLRQAEDAGFVVNVEDKKNRPARFEITNEASAMPSEAILPTLEQLTEAWERVQQRRQQASPQTPRNRPQQRNGRA